MRFTWRSADTSTPPPTFALALPLYGRLKRKVDELFYRRQTDAGTLASLLHKLSAAVQSRPPEETLRQCLETALSLGVECAELWRVSDTGEVLQRLRHEGVASTTQATELSRRVSEADVADWLDSLPQVSAGQPLPPGPPADEATRTSALPPPK